MYGAVWGSNVGFASDDKGSSEPDVTAGGVGALSDDRTLGVNPTHYRYPSMRVGLDRTEAVRLGAAALRDVVTGKMAPCTRPTTTRSASRSPR